MTPISTKKNYTKIVKIGINFSFVSVRVFLATLVTYILLRAAEILYTGSQCQDGNIIVKMRCSINNIIMDFFGNLYGALRFPFLSSSEDRGWAAIAASIIAYWCIQFIVLLIIVCAFIYLLLPRIKSLIRNK